MAKSRSNQISKSTIIIIVIVLSIIMYLAGVFSGLYANTILKQEVDTELDELKAIMDVSSLDIKNLLLQQFFLDNFNVDDRCRFLGLYLHQQYGQLGYYWDKLPARLEEYEKEAIITDDYLALKREYIRLSLRVWLVASNNYLECGNQEFVPLLYFYNKDCSDCLAQGEEFDIFNRRMKGLNKTVIVFPIDSEFEDDLVFLMKEYYAITDYPATIIINEPYQGRVIDAVELQVIAGLK